MVNKTNMRLTTIILCLVLVLGIIIFFSTSDFINQPKVENTSSETTLPNKPTAEESINVSNASSLTSVAEETVEETNDEIQTQAKLTKTISKYANQTAENDLLRYQAEKLEQEIQEKLQNLEEKKPQ